jgi:murein L,D-transpeptidase YafK
LRAISAWHADPDAPPRRRVAEAERVARPIVLGLFADAGVSFPPSDVLFRVFKQEKELEVWANGKRDEPMKRIATYEVCAMSGGPGPKRAEGDLQVPEGFYRIKYFWPDSSFYLSANVGYPNVSDRILGGPKPGSEIMIHGGCASIGCVAMSDERIQELWVMGTGALHAGRPVHVHMFPARDFAPLLEDASHAPHHAFWRNLREGLDAFESGRRIPAVTVDTRGRYVVR